MASITLLQGDITQAETDAIVNAANPIMLGGGGVDGAIHRAAGPALLEACKQVKAINGVRCPTGEARITASGNLKSKYVMHTVGPIYTNHQHPENYLRAAYQNSLKLALSNDCHSIAFPAISCGVYGYPLHEAAEVALSVCLQKEYTDLKIVFYLFDNNIFMIWNQCYQSLVNK